MDESQQQCHTTACKRERVRRAPKTPEASATALSEARFGWWSCRHAGIQSDCTDCLQVCLLPVNVFHWTTMKPKTPHPSWTRWRHRTPRKKIRSYLRPPPLRRARHLSASLLPRVLHLHRSLFVGKFVLCSWGTSTNFPTKKKAFVHATLHAAEMVRDQQGSIGCDGSEESEEAAR